MVAGMVLVIIVVLLMVVINHDFLVGPRGKWGHMGKRQWKAAKSLDPETQRNGRITDLKSEQSPESGILETRVMGENTDW